MNAGTKWGLTPKQNFGGLKTENYDRCLQFGAYYFSTEVNFCTLKTAVKPEENGLQDGCSNLTFDLSI